VAIALRAEAAQLTRAHRRAARRPAAGHADRRAMPHGLTRWQRTGCRTWGQLRALPRGGVARRFGAALLQAGQAYGERPEVCPWLALPEVFDMRLELPALATTTP
jgi:protein ImuB